MKSMKILLAAAMLATALPLAQVNATVADAPGDFLGSYTGPPNGDMDVLSADVFLDIVDNNFILTATMNGTIGTTATGLYVLGVDRGGATLAPFGSTGNGNVIFNSVVVLNDNATGSVTIIGGSTTPLAAGSITISGSSLTAIIP
ncbi:MAG TPA: hypothetical protein VET48_02510, partial [Steroidobacteraceae bacterium]|nr:hypothetical protein [Steroidobacteraceae bacterium]